MLIPLSGQNPEKTHTCIDEMEGEDTQGANAMPDGTYKGERLWMIPEGIANRLLTAVFL